MESLRAVGFMIPSWEELILAENQNRVPVEEEDRSQPRFGRQQEAVAVHHTFLERELRPLLGETEEALLRSQGGPLASVPFTSLPTMRETSFAASLSLSAPLSALTFIHFSLKKKSRKKKTILIVPPFRFFFSSFFCHFFILTFWMVKGEAKLA